MAQNNIIPAAAGSVVSKRGERSIGAILIDAGKLTPEDAERILRLQRDLGVNLAGIALALQLIDRTQDQGRSGDALKCVYYEADGHARLKVIFEYCEGEHYYKYSGWKRLWSQHTLYDSSVDRVDMAELRKIFGDVVRAWFESHLRRNRDLVLRHMKKAYERVETFNQ